MKFIGLDEESYEISIAKYIGKKRTKVSQYHKRCRELLEELYPCQMIIEELALKGFDRKKTLYADFFVPAVPIIVEVHGEQHYTHVTFMHATRQKFLMAQKNDRDKREWCRINEIELIELDHKDDTDKWREQLEEQ
jgi:very-short-patch-repair endonuclease